MRKKSRAGGNMLPVFREHVLYYMFYTSGSFVLYFKATAIKTEWNWQKNRQSPMEQNREPCIYDQLIFDRGAKNI